MYEYISCTLPALPMASSYIKLINDIPENTLFFLSTRALLPFSFFFPRTCQVYFDKYTHLKYTYILIPITSVVVKLDRFPLITMKYMRNFFEFRKLYAIMNGKQKKITFRTIVRGSFHSGGCVQIWNKK